MVNIVTHVENSNIFEIGKNVDELSSMNPFVVNSTNKEIVQAFSASHRHAKDGLGNPAEGANEVQSICDSLVVSQIEFVGGAWVPKNTIPQNSSDNLLDIADVKFVLEKENEKIIVIPHKNALDYAKQQPPLAEGAYEGHIRNEAVEDLKQHIDDNLALYSGVGVPKAKVMEILDIALGGAFGPQNPMDTFYQQLGSYTCRQCG